MLKIAKDSIAQSKPIIIVSVQYRLNIFHVGDGLGTKNLGLKDLQVAVQWVREHISGFGGNPVSALFCMGLELSLSRYADMRRTRLRLRAKAPELRWDMLC